MNELFQIPLFIVSDSLHRDQCQRSSIERGPRLSPSGSSHQVWICVCVCVCVCMCVCVCACVCVCVCGVCVYICVWCVCVLEG